MVAYNPKDWFKLILQFHKSDTFRLLIPAMIGVGIYAGLIVKLEQHMGWSIKNATAVHAILGFVLSMLLVFRTNTAYDRWWEGRKIFGSLVNTCRNLSLKLSVFIPGQHATERRELDLLIGGYMACLKNHLRDQYIAAEFEGTASLSEQELSKAGHKPNRIAQSIYGIINRLYLKKVLSNEQMLMLNEEVRTLTDCCGACERIKTTPIPYSYNIFLKKVVFLYVMTLPLMFCSDFGYATIPITIMVLYVFASIELIAEEIEDPFGNDDNDLPTDAMSKKIKTNVHEIFERHDL